MNKSLRMDHSIVMQKDVISKYHMSILSELISVWKPYLVTVPVVEVQNYTFKPAFVSNLRRILLVTLNHT